MKKINWFVLLLVAASLSACAPAYYEASYYDYPDPSGRVAVVTNHSYSNYGYRTIGGHYGSIEVTLIANSGFLGASLQPIYLVMHDGAYVEVPVRNRHGALKNIYAHYHQGDLHFDSGRHCNNLHGTSRFKYDKRWDGGHRYKHVSAGPDYDLSGYEIHIRKHVNKKKNYAGSSGVGNKDISKHYDYSWQHGQHKAGSPRKKSHEYDSRSRKRHANLPLVKTEAKKRKVDNRHVHMDNRVEQKVRGKKVQVRQDKKNNDQTERQKRVVRKKGSRSKIRLKSENIKKAKRFDKKRLLKNKHINGKHKVNSEHIKQKEKKKKDIDLEADRLAAVAGVESSLSNGKRQHKPYSGPLRKNIK